MPNSSRPSCSSVCASQGPWILDVACSRGNFLWIVFFHVFIHDLHPPLSFSLFTPSDRQLVLSFHVPEFPCAQQANLGPVVHDDDLKLAQMICKATQPEWRAIVSKPTFICVGCDEECNVADGYTNEVIFQREAVARVVKQMIQDGKRVNGLMAILKN